MDRFTVTAYIRCYKDPQLVLECASHLGWADEIFIADNSDDDSVKNIVSKINHKNVQYKYTDIVDFRERITHLKDQVAGDFILMIDTDEFYHEDAGVEILKVLSDKENIKEGYIVPSESYVFGEYLSKGDDQLRLFMKDKFYFEFKSIHEMPLVKNATGKLHNGYKHYNSPTFASQVHKPYIYAMADARILSDDMLQKNRVDHYSSYQIKKHFFITMLKMLWRSKGLFFSRKVNFMHYGYAISTFL